MRHGGRATGTIAGALGVIGLGATMVAGVLGMTAPGPAVPAVVATAAAIAAPATDSLEQVIRSLLGLSGRLRAVSFATDSLRALPLAALVPALATRTPGLHSTGLAAPNGDPIRVLNLVPLRAKRGPTWNVYRVGFWPGNLL